jgi:uncharacterized membrane protein
MGVEGDRVDLSPSELQALAQMEAMASATDPTLDARLRALRRFHVPKRLPVWYALIGLLLGIAIMLLTIGFSFWLAAFGVILTGASLYWGVEDLTARLVRKRGGPGASPAR